jgi:hypothetical protein
MSSGYTYATLSVRPGEPSRVRVGFHLDERAEITLYGAGTGHVHLNVSHGEAAVTFTPPVLPVTEQDVQLAQTLAAQTAAYAAEIGRLHAEHTTQAAANAA